MNKALLLLACSAGFCLVGLFLYVRSRTLLGLQSPHRTRDAREVDPQRGDLKSDLRRIFWVAFGIRAFVGALLLLTGWALYLGPDTYTYLDVGSSVAQGWRDGVSATSSIPMRAGTRNFAYFIGAVFFVTGRAPLVIVAFTAAAGAWTAVLGARIANHIGGHDAAIRAGWLICLFPSLILWSATVLRDPFTIVAVTGCVWATIQLRENPSVLPAVSLGIWLTLAGLMRGYLFILLATGVVAAFLVAKQGRAVRSYVGAALGIIVVAVLAGFTGLGSDYYEFVDMERIAAVRTGMTQGAQSAFLPDVDISTPGKALVFLPVGLVYFILAPFPWDLTGLRQWLTAPEMIVWYWALAMMWFGLRQLWKQSASHLWLVLTVLGTISVTYALVSGNLGTAYRHRAQVVPLILTVASVGWVSRRKLTVAQRAKSSS